MLVSELNDFFKTLPSLNADDIKSFEEDIKDMRKIKTGMDEWE